MANKSKWKHMSFRPTHFEDEYEQQHHHHQQMEEDDDGDMFPTPEECDIIQQKSWKIIIDPNRPRQTRPRKTTWHMSNSSQSDLSHTAAAAESPSHSLSSSYRPIDSAISVDNPHHTTSTTSPSTTHSNTTTSSSGLTAGQSAQLSPASHFTSSFYTHLLDTNPYLATVFPDIQKQSAALSGVLQKCVRDVGRLRNEAVMREVKRLGYRHAVLYNITPPMYDAFGKSLVVTVRDSLVQDGSWTPEVDWAWQKVYGLIAKWMKEGGQINGYSAPQGGRSHGGASGTSGRHGNWNGNGNGERKMKAQGDTGSTTSTARGGWEEGSAKEKGDKCVVM
ncbi:hypothetical protein HK102_003485 [Quaeritorhiza haematococci]|nr:hypothetical protein HK102_003485 [Quaeritorhiza haematococci]